ncbi:class I SAM-dependent methyltransferase [Acidobacteriota bacterium]
MSKHKPSINEVFDFWERNPCDAKDSNKKDRLAYFNDIEQKRYSRLPYIPKIAKFSAYAGKRVLEIGCGLGTDGVQFSKYGALYTGIDLTAEAVMLARQNFTLRGISAKFCQADAEALPFPKEIFDHVFSHGVIHHTPRPEKIVAEIYRVLKPGGTITVMLYNKNSINYYIEIMFLRKIGRRLLRPSWAPHLLASLSGFDQTKLAGHRTKLFSIPNPTPEQWISMNTDGPYCPLAKIYSASESAALFAEFYNFRTEVHNFDRSHWSFLGRIISTGLADKIGHRWGWSRIVYATKPIDNR